MRTAMATGEGMLLCRIHNDLQQRANLDKRKKRKHKHTSNNHSSVDVDVGRQMW